jgi:flagellar protein FliS
MYTGSSPFMNHTRAPAFGRASQAYARVGVETGVDGASPHQLVAMLYDGLLDSLARARGALREGQIDRKCAELTRAVRIVDEGLKAALSPEGGDLAHHLNELYAYLSLRLTQANLRNDDAALEECKSLVGTLRDAWQSIAPAAARRPDA